MNDQKLTWLIAASILVGVLEFMALSGFALPPMTAIPLFSLIILIIGYSTLIQGLKALLRLNFRSINLLMLIAVSGAFYLGQYEEGAVVIVLYTLAEKLEDVGIAKSRSALDSLVKKMPKEVSIKGKQGTTLLKEVLLDDIIELRPGTMIPLDGTVVKGSSSVDESTITGEPVPIDKTRGDQVFAGTLNQQGYLEVRITKRMEDTALAKIRDLTFQANATKAKTQKFIEKFSQIYTPAIILCALALTIFPVFVFGQPFNRWFLEAITLLVISCPCALVISTPISIFSAIGNASKQGVLIKGGRYLEALGKLKAAAFDKTRTLTVGKPDVTDVIPYNGHSREHLLSCAAGIEQLSDHPLSQSIVEAADREQIALHEVENFENFTGKGVKADCLICRTKHHCVGKLHFILEEHPVPQEIIDRVEQLQNSGKTVVVVCTDQHVEGVIALADSLRNDSRQTIEELQRMGVKTVMVTGDHEIPARQIAEKIRIDEYHAGLLPDDKARIIGRLLHEYGTVAMIGDGINDAPSLAFSSVGITMSSLGSDAAIDAASVVILNDRLKLIPEMIRLGRRTLRMIRFNTTCAVLIKFVFILLAFAGKSNLVLAIFADVGVTILVILNSLRLLRTPPR